MFLEQARRCFVFVEKQIPESQKRNNCDLHALFGALRRSKKVAEDLHIEVVIIIGAQFVWISNRKSGWDMAPNYSCMSSIVCFTNKAHVASSTTDERKQKKEFLFQLPIDWSRDCERLAWTPLKIWSLDSSRLNWLRGFFLYNRNDLRLSFRKWTLDLGSCVVWQTRLIRVQFDSSQFPYLMWIGVNRNELNPKLRNWNFFYPIEKGVPRLSPFPPMYVCMQWATFLTFRVNVETRLQSKFSSSSSGPT